MALSANTVWEVRTTGNDNNGGGFVAGASGTDRSQQDTAHVSGTNLTVDGTTNTDVAPDGYTAGAADVGNIIQITAGAGFTQGFYQIVSIQAGKWRLDRSPAATSTSGGTWAMGGALASPGKACGVIVAGNTVFVKTGTYSISSASSNVSNGVLSAGARAFFIGYNTNRVLGNSDTPPVFQATTGTLTLFSWGATGFAYNLTLDGNSQTAARAVNSGTYINCTIKNTNLASQGSPNCIGCLATANSATIFNGTSYYCEAYANTATPFTGAVTYCLSYANTGASTDGFSQTGNLSVWIGCVSVSNGRSGFRNNNGGQIQVAQNCIAESNGGGGYVFGGAGNGHLVNCAYYNNTGGNVSGATELNSIAVTAGSVFTDPSNGDFSLNNLASRGALLRAAGAITFMGQFFPRGLTRSYLNIGAAQHQALGGGGSIIGSNIIVPQMN